MNPEYRKSIDPKYSRKIEAVVRKPPKNGKDEEPLGDPVEPLSPCPYCENMLPETEMACTKCKNNIPFCIVTVSGSFILIISQVNLKFLGPPYN